MKNKIIFSALLLLVCCTALCSCAGGFSGERKFTDAAGREAEDIVGKVIDEIRSELDLRYPGRMPQVTEGTPATTVTQIPDLPQTTAMTVELTKTESGSDIPEPEPVYEDQPVFLEKGDVEIENCAAPVYAVCLPTYEHTDAGMRATVRELKLRRSWIVNSRGDNIIQIEILDKGERKLVQRWYGNVSIMGRDDAYDTVYGVDGITELTIFNSDFEIGDNSIDGVFSFTVNRIICDQNGVRLSARRRADTPDGAIFHSFEDLYADEAEEEAYRTLYELDFFFRSVADINVDINKYNYRAMDYMTDEEVRIFCEFYRTPEESEIIFSQIQDIDRVKIENTAYKYISAITAID